MSEMVERVARHIAGSAWGDLTEEHRGYFLARGRAAVRAMREPTEQMIAIVSGAMYDHFTSADIPLAPKDAETLRTRLRKAAADNWRSMIDAAFKE